MALARRLLVTGGGASVSAAVPVIDVLYAAPNGGWPSVSGQAIRYDGSVYFGWVDASGNVDIGKYVEATETTTTFNLRPTFEVDWHDAPAIAVRDDGRIVAAYSKHNGHDMLVRISTSAGDISAWSSEVDIQGQMGGDNYTYPVMFTDEDGTIWLFHRRRPPASSTSTWCYTTSADGGTTWTTGVELFETPGVMGYWHVGFDGVDRFDFVCSDDSDIPSPTLYHFYMQGGVRYDTDGSIIGASLPLEVGDLSSVVTGNNAAPIAVYHNNGSPVIVYPTYTLPGTMTWHYAIWESGAWAVRTITSHTVTATAWVYGGVAIESAGRLWLSIPSSGHYSMHRYQTFDAGNQWSGELLDLSPSDDFYPIPVQHPGRLRALALRGTAVDYTNYNLGIVAVKR